MDKLDLFDSKQFALAFCAVTDKASSVGNESEPDATVRLEGGAASPGAAFAWEGGQIDYQGNRHAFSITGLSIANVPTGSVSAAGIVKRLRSLSEFAGSYVAAAAEAGVTAGRPVAYLKNDRGVLIQFVARNAGQRFDVSVNGVRIRFKRQLLERTVF
ncbi:MAG: hypothetical protein ACLPV8_10385 [Steroidobacteraceae bacterium]